MFRIFIFAFVSNSVVFGQIDSVRKDFLRQRINSLKEEIPKAYNVVEIRKLRWDTLERVYDDYFKPVDTADISNIAIKAKSSKRKIVTMMNTLTSKDYETINNQIANQDKDAFFAAQKLRESKKKRETYIISISQPLVVLDGNMVIVREEHRGGGCFSYATESYKKLEGNWVRFLILDQLSVCQ